MKITATLALIAVATITSWAAANADAMSDQKKAYQVLGRQIKSQPPMCKLLPKADVERFVGAPVNDGGSAGPVDGCAWYAANGSGDGMLVVRGPRARLPDASSMPSPYERYKKVNGVGDQAYTVYSPSGYQAEAVSAKGTTTVILHSKNGSADKALAALRIALNR